MADSAMLPARARRNPRSNCPSAAAHRACGCGRSWPFWRRRWSRAHQCSARSASCYRQPACRTHRIRRRSGFPPTAPARVRAGPHARNCGRRRILVGCEVDSEVDCAAFVAVLAEESDSVVHLDIRNCRGGDPLAIVETAVSELRMRRNRHGAYADRAIFWTPNGHGRCDLLSVPGAGTFRIAGLQGRVAELLIVGALKPDHCVVAGGGDGCRPGSLQSTMPASRATVPAVARAA